MAPWYRKQGGEWTLTPPIYWTEEEKRGHRSSIEMDILTQPTDDMFDWSGPGQAGLKPQYRTH